jgi:hypothetical protein
MAEQHDMTGNFETALANAEKGIVSIPVLPGTKVPAVKWKRWQSAMPTERLFREWFAGTANNIAIVTTDMVVFDCESVDEAALVLAACGETPHLLATPRGGVHLGYRRPTGASVQNRRRINGQLIDIRTDGGLEMIPNSRTEHGEYRWIGDGLRPVTELPPAKIGWTQQNVQRSVSKDAIEGAPDVMVRRALAYLAHVEGAISGQRGHDRTFRVACVLTRKFGLTVEQAMPIFQEWNQQCEPPWSERELLHKLEDAAKQ